MVGVNRHVEENEKPLNILRIGKEAEERQINRLKAVKSGRDEDSVRKALNDLRNAFLDENKNIMPYVIEAVKSYATIEEISNVGREIYGGWKEPVIV